MIRSVDVREKKFEKAAVFGYKTEDVESFLENTADRLEELEEQNQDLLGKLEVLAEKLEEYRSDEDSLRSALLGAHRLGDSVIKEAKVKAEDILSEAAEKAEKLLTEADAAADKMREDAEEAAQKLSKETTQTNEALLARYHAELEHEKKNLSAMQKEVSEFKSKLLSLYKEHLDVISSLPEFHAEEEARESATDDTQSEPVEESVAELITITEQLELSEETDDGELSELEA